MAGWSSESFLQSRRKSDERKAVQAGTNAGNGLREEDPAKRRKEKEKSFFLGCTPVGIHYLYS
jgi:hypothetical protein